MQPLILAKFKTCLDRYPIRTCDLSSRIGVFCDGVVEAEPRCGEDLFGAQLVPVHVGGSLEDLPRGQVHVEQDRVVVGGRPDSASAEHA